jgi:hypothetical protein
LQRRRVRLIGGEEFTLTSSKEYLGLLAGIIAILLIGWLLIVQVEEFAVW